MGRTFVAVGLWLAMAGNGVSAESAKDALEVFGLVGTWSADCSKDLTKEAGSRKIYDVPAVGAPGFSEIIRLNTGVTSKFKGEIQEATRITEDKIRLIYKGSEITFSNGAKPGASEFDPVQTILEKVGQKVRVLDWRHADGSQTLIENGMISAKYPVLLIEKCLD